jgi:DivIVA domain-containing protein
MALLSAEDVLNKAFSKTKYREGFDQDEVDDFLDEVAHTIQSLEAERDDLAQRLAQAQAGGAAMVAPATPDVPPAEPSAAGGLLAAATDPNPPSPTGMLAMAQKLHDEYVHAGEEERDRIIDEGRFKAEQIVERAEADAKSRMEDLSHERSELESKIDDLRRFERDYRARLKAYLENLMGDLDHGAGKDRAPMGLPLPVVAEPADVDTDIAQPDTLEAFAESMADAEPTPEPAAEPEQAEPEQAEPWTGGLNAVDADAQEVQDVPAPAAEEMAPFVAADTYPPGAFGAYQPEAQVEAPADDLPTVAAMDDVAAVPGGVDEVEAPREAPASAFGFFSPAAQEPPADAPAPASPWANPFAPTTSAYPLAVDPATDGDIAVDPASGQDARVFRTPPPGQEN